jgi:signal transduction histidine kinase
MQNMRKRMEEIGGDFRVASEPSRGTDVTFAMALNVKRAIPAGVERDARESESGL